MKKLSWGADAKTRLSSVTIKYYAHGAESFVGGGGIEICSHSLGGTKPLPLLKMESASDNKNSILY